MLRSFPGIAFYHKSPLMRNDKKNLISGGLIENKAPPREVNFEINARAFR